MRLIILTVLLRGLELPPPGLCPETALPVCGADGRTYTNECFASCAAVAIAHSGPCDEGGCNVAGHDNPRDPGVLVLGLPLAVLAARRRRSRA
jgi:MYXO-CTERM domain-containing protein